MKSVFFLPVFLIASIFLVNSAYGDAISPIRQLNAGIIPSEVVCNDGLVRIVDHAKNKSACVKSSSVETLVKRGWQEAPGRQVQATEINDTIKPISTTKVEGVGVKKSTTAVYDHVFEICAGSINLVAPEVIIKSDIETKTVIISADVTANSCIISAATIIAIDDESVQSELRNQDSIIAKIASVRSDIERSILQLEEERMKFATILAEQDGETKKQRMDESIAKISQLRQSISGLKDDLNRYYFVLYDVPKSKTVQQSKVSFTGSDITERSVKIISLTPARTEGVFDVALEVCAGNNPISDPMISLSSDRKQSTLKLNKVIANTCYKTGAKIDATLQESITASFVDSVSDTIALESTIRQLESKISQTRAELTNLTQNTINPDPKRIHQLTEEITALRADIVAAKAMYYQSLYKAYKAE